MAGNYISDEHSYLSSIFGEELTRRFLISANTSALENLAAGKSSFSREFLCWMRDEQSASDVEKYFRYYVKELEVRFLEHPKHESP